MGKLNGRGNLMISYPIEIEGTWEQISAQAQQFVKHKMRLTILPDVSVESDPADSRSLDEKIAEIIAGVPVQEWEKLPADMGDNLDHYLYGTPKRP